MTTRMTHPDGVPCWVDLWTSDVAGARAFYREVFGWESTEPDPAFGGYFSFLRDGAPVAGAMGDMGEPGSEFHMPADNTWRPYLATSDIHAAISTATAAGAEFLTDAHHIGTLGWNTVLTDPTGAKLGLWQAEDHPGFIAVDEPGAPAWFELFTRDHDGAVAFYRDVFGLETEVIGDTDEFRYTTLNDSSDRGQVGGIMDAGAWMPEGVAAYWSVYWGTDDVDASVATITGAGGSLVAGPEDTPYGRMATVTDPFGAEFKLREPRPS